MRFAFILVEKATYPVILLCKVLQVSASGFYAWCRRKPSRRAREDVALKVHIRASFKAGRKKYGSPRIYESMHSQHGIGRRRVARLMREDGLSVRRKRRFVCTTDSKHSYAVAPNTSRPSTTASESIRRSALSVLFTTKPLPFSNVWQHNQTVHQSEARSLEIYNLRVDPGETKNLLEVKGPAADGYVKGLRLFFKVNAYTRNGYVPPIRRF
jgi:HTH-like domain